MDFNSSHQEKQRSGAWETMLSIGLDIALYFKMTRRQNFKGSHCQLIEQKVIEGSCAVTKCRSPQNVNKALLSA